MPHVTRRCENAHCWKIWLMQCHAIYHFHLVEKSPRNGSYSNILYFTGRGRPIRGRGGGDQPGNAPAPAYPTNNNQPPLNGFDPAAPPYQQPPPYQQSPPNMNHQQLPPNGAGDFVRAAPTAGVNRSNLSVHAQEFVPGQFFAQVRRDNLSFRMWYGDLITFWHHIQCTKFIIDVRASSYRCE